MIIFTQIIFFTRAESISRKLNLFILSFDFHKNFIKVLTGSLLDRNLSLKQMNEIHAKIKKDFDGNLGKTSPHNFVPYHLFIEYKKPKKDLFLIGKITNKALRTSLYQASKGRNVLFKKEEISAGVCFMVDNKLHIFQDLSSSGRKNDIGKALRRIIKSNPKIKDIAWLTKADYDKLTKVTVSSQESSSDDSNATATEPQQPPSLESYESYVAYIDDSLEVMKDVIDLDWYKQTFLPKLEAKRVVEDDINEGKSIKTDMLSFLLLLGSSSPDAQKEYKDLRKQYLAFIKDWDKQLSSGEKQAKKNTLSQEERKVVNQTLLEMNQLRAQTKEILQRTKLSDFTQK